jgi:transcriptional antiterminator Rof (Rho-off)
MEPLSALSLAAAVAQLVDYGFKILGNVREISSSLSGATEENQSLENATRVMQRLTEMLASSKLGSLPDEQDILSDLVAECLSLSDQLLALLDKIKAKDLKSKIQLTLAAVKSKRYEKEKLRLQKRLEDCQLRLDRYLTALSRCVLSTMLFSAA